MWMSSPSSRQEAKFSKENWRRNPRPVPLHFGQYCFFSCRKLKQNLLHHCVMYVLYVSVYVCMYVWCVCMVVCIHARMCVWVCICIYIHLCIFMYACMYVWMYVCIHTHIHVCGCVDTPLVLQDFREPHEAIECISPWWLFWHVREFLLDKSTVPFLPDTLTSCNSPPMMIICRVTLHVLVTKKLAWQKLLWRHCGITFSHSIVSCVHHPTRLDGWLNHIEPGLAHHMACYMIA